MSGISEIQKRRIFEEITRLFFSSGENPRLIDVQTEIANYFSKYPVGLPLPLPLDFVDSGLKSNVDKFNEILANLTLNVGTLYESSGSQVNEILLLTTVLRTHLERLNARRKRLETQIDDYLFSLYNTDGYYYSSSDTFADTSLVDLKLSNAFVDVNLGSVVLPTVSSLTTKLDPSKASTATVGVTVDGVVANFITNGPFTSALDGLTNTAWAIELSTDQPAEVICTVSLAIGTRGDPVSVSRVEFDPYGITPVQLSINGTISTSAASSTSFSFGNRIQTSASKMAFADTAKDIETLTLTLRKTQPDYNVNDNNNIKYKYIFGAKDIAITQHAYDNEAIFISSPLTLPPDLAADNVIDAVTLVVDSSNPVDTSISYYVAADVDTNSPALADFNWRTIDPLSTNSDPLTSIVKFDGTLNLVKYIKPQPSSSDLQLIPIDPTNDDQGQVNPSLNVIPGVDVYRIAEFDEDILTSSISLEEGINSTRILHTTLNSTAVDSLVFWSDYINGTKTATQVYGSIDSGTEFFYGGDVGDSGRSVYVETFLDSLSDQELILREFKKSDLNSKQWAVRVFLNGKEIGNLPALTDSLVLPWKFQEGLNHICLIVNIPEATDDYPHPYMGKLDLMGDSSLTDFGSVKLGTWQYVDFFHLKFNTTGQPQIFTIYNNEIISRRKPTTNFRLRYSKATNGSPTAVRVRADLSRSGLNQHVSPSFDSYRLRFLYGQKQ